MTGRADHYPSTTGVCLVCGKHGTYRSRKAARRAAHANHPGEHLTAYMCSPGLWHYGHDFSWLGKSTADVDAPLVRPHRPTPQSALAQIAAVARAAPRDGSPESG